MNGGFWPGVLAVAGKELLHIVRDRLTLALLVSVPLVQLLLFGFAIELHPRNLPTALVAQEDDGLVERAVEELESLGYFKVVARTRDVQEAERWLASSRVQFIFELPEGFSQRTVTGRRPTMNLIVDATDPVASLLGARAAEARYTSAGLKSPPAVQLVVEQRYSPDGASRRFVVPGLLGVVLTLTLVLLGALSLVRERERGSYDMLMLLPIPRTAILVGKVAPYFVLGCVLFCALLILCVQVLGLPWPEVSLAFMLSVVMFVGANLALGFAISLLASNQMQAMQMGIFFYLPSMLLSGFMFPFHGMPGWARGIGELLPLTHFLRVVRGVLLKQLPADQIGALSWPIAVFAIGATLLALGLFRRSG